MNPYNEEDSAADLAVIGLGPGGLAGALKAAELGKKVVAFTDRKEYIRGQRLILSHKTVHFLESYRNPDDKEPTRASTRRGL